MSRARDLLRRDDAGFTLVEVLVAFLILALVAAAMVPLLVLGATTATQTRKQTEGKNLAQERIEQMRQLPFHVDRQNGPFVDLLDNYYPNRAAAAALGQGWVAEGGTRQAGEPPTGSFYRTVIDPVPGNPEFRQVVATQFLRFNRQPVAQAAFATYDSQASGLDSPPSLFVGVWVVTTWTSNGEAQRNETFTQISDPGAPAELIASQAKVTALRVESTAPDTTTFLTAEAATVQADGRLSDGSSAAVTATAARATRTGTDPWSGVSRTSVSPAGNQFPVDESLAAVASPDGDCRHAAFGRGTVSKVTSAITVGVPFVPADVGTGAAVPTNRAGAALLANPGGGCGAFWFDNESLLTDARLRLLPGRPLVAVRGTTSGNAPIVRASAWVNGTDEFASPAFVRSGAEASTPEAVGLFFTDFAGSTSPLLTLRLLSSSITCDSRNATPATASYEVEVRYRRFDGAYVPVTATPTITWNSSTGPAGDPLAGVDLGALQVFDDPLLGPVADLTLADYIESWSTGRAVTEGDSGVTGLETVLRVTTNPVRASDATSSVGVVLGAMSCVADDNR